MKNDFYLWAKILVFLYNRQDKKVSSLRICKEMGIAAPSSISQNIKILGGEGLLKYERQGRMNKYKLTDKGEKVAEYLQRIINLLK